MCNIEHYHFLGCSRLIKTQFEFELDNRHGETGGLVIGTGPNRASPLVNLVSAKPLII